MSTKQKRVCLWAAPRSLSTAMCRVMMNSPYKTQVLFEPFGKAYFLGPERGSKLYNNSPLIDPVHTYENCRKKLDLPYEGKELVFAKLIARQFQAKRMTADWIPDGYTHTLMIRHPRSAATSMVKALDRTRPGQEYQDPLECGFKELVQIFHLLRNLGHKVVVFDADDLMDNPEGILQLYCQEVGLEFCDSMINWKPMSKAEREMLQADVWEEAWLSQVLNSTTIKRRPNSNHRNGASDDTLDTKRRNIIEKAVEDNIQYYEELYANRLKL